MTPILNKKEKKGNNFQKIGLISDFYWFWPVLTNFDLFDCSNDF